MDGIKYLYLVDSQGYEVDRIEYDTNATPAAVQQVQDALGVDFATAADFVAQHNPDAAKTSEEQARALAQNIVDGKVEGYPTSKTSGWKVTDVRPPSLVGVELAQAASVPTDESTGE